MTRIYPVRERRVEQPQGWNSNYIRSSSVLGLRRWKGTVRLDIQISYW